MGPGKVYYNIANLGVGTTTLPRVITKKYPKIFLKSINKFLVEIKESSPAGMWPRWKDISSPNWSSWNNNKIYVDILTGENCCYFRLLKCTSLISQFVQNGGMVWERGWNVILASCKYHFITVHDNLVQHPSYNITNPGIVIYY